MSTSFWLDRSSHHDRRSYDAIIVGAGISGLSTAYWLHKEDPSLKIAIVEKSRMCFGASGRNAGFITCGSVEHFNRMINKHGLAQATEIWRFAQENLRLLKQEIVQDDAEKLEFEHNGAYSLATQPNEFEELKKVAQIMNDLKIRTEIIDQQTAEKRVGAHNFVGGIKYLDDASVNPVKLVNHIFSKTKSDLHEGVEAFGIESTNEQTRILKTDKGDFEAPLILLNLNGYSFTLHPWFQDKIFPTRGQCLMMESVPRFMDAPCYANFYLDYFRQMPTGELLIGGFRQVEKETEVGISDNITEGIQVALQKFVNEHLPNYKNSRVTHRWSGVMGFSKDGEPMVGALPDDPQVFFAGGYTAHGIGLSFHTTKRLVDVIYGRDIEPWLSARRFT
ncbi:MAG: NAD(P)/FAD-dependent oxidoreductase [Bdellovibrionales bacterium]